MTRILGNKLKWSTGAIFFTCTVILSNDYLCQLWLTVIFKGYLQFGLGNQSEVQFNITVSQDGLLCHISKDLARGILLTFVSSMINRSAEAQN